MPRRRRTLDPAGSSSINKHTHRIGVPDADTEHSQLFFYAFTGLQSFWAYRT